MNLRRNPPPQPGLKFQFIPSGNIGELKGPVSDIAPWWAFVYISTPAPEDAIAPYYHNVYGPICELSEAELRDLRSCRYLSLLDITGLV